MNQTARIERWTLLADEAAAVARDYEAAWAATPIERPCPALDPALNIRMASVRGQARGLDFTRLPFPAWETGKDFLWLLAAVVDEDRTPALRLQHVAELVGTAALLVEILATSAHRPRADLD